MSQIIEPAITAAPACKITEFHIKDFWSSMTHFIGFIMSFCGSLFLMQRAFSTEQPIAIASMGIFSLSLMLLYAASTIYHTLDLDARRNQILKKADAVTTVSPWHKEYLSQLNKNVHLIYNGYSEEIFYPKDVKSDTFDIIYAGRLLDPNAQNPELLFKAIEHLKLEK